MKPNLYKALQVSTRPVHFYALDSFSGVQPALAILSRPMIFPKGMPLAWFPFDHSKVTGENKPKGITGKKQFTNHRIQSKTATFSNLLSVAKRGAAAKDWS